VPAGSRAVEFAVSARYPDVPGSVTVRRFAGPVIAASTVGVPGGGVRVKWMSPVRFSHTARGCAVVVVVGVGVGVGMVVGVRSWVRWV